jgi:ankyrin repeat protein
MGTEIYKKPNKQVKKEEPDTSEQMKSKIVLKNQNRMTPLMWAAVSEPEKCESLIEKGADVNERDRFGWTALHYAANSGRPEICELLIKNGAKAGAKTDNGQTSLMLAEFQFEIYKEEKYSKTIDILKKAGAKK